MLTTCRQPVFGTESSTAVVEPSIHHNQALCSKFYMPVDECRAHSCLFLYYELQFWAFKINFKISPCFFLYVKMKKVKLYQKKSEMAPRSCKQLGKNAKVSIVTKYLHPNRLINEVLQNYESNHRLNNCIVVRMEERKVNRCNQLVIELKHKDFKTNDGEPQEIYAVTR